MDADTDGLRSGGVLARGAEKAAEAALLVEPATAIAISAPPIACMSPVVWGTDEIVAGPRADLRVVDGARCW